MQRVTVLFVLPRFHASVYGNNSSYYTHIVEQYICSMYVRVNIAIIIIIIMAGMAVFLRGWLPHRSKAQMACNY